MSNINKKKLDILIVDDEIKALNYLKSLVQECLENHPHFIVNKIFTFNNSLEAHDFLLKNTTHIAFIDINMPGKTGIELTSDLKLIKSNNKMNFPIACFTTAYDNYALKAYENDVFEYILKPISIESLEKFFDKLSSINFYNDGKKFSFYENGMLHNINVKDILYLKNDGKYLNLITPNKTYLTLESLQNFEKNYNNFIKIHRSYLVNKSHIKSIFQKDNQLYIKLSDLKTELPVSRRNRQDVEKELSNFIILY